MPSHYDYDLIRDYLHGLVDQRTARDLGELIEKDETARSIAQGIIFLEKNFRNEQEVDEYLLNFRVRQEALIAKLNARPPGLPLWLKIAASVLIVTAAALLVRLNATSPDVLALVADELADPYPVSGIVRGDVVKGSFEMGLDQYAAGNYALALQHFNQSAVASDPATLYFYKGLSCLYTGKPAEAAKLFDSGVIAESRYVQQARWNRALALIQSGEFDDARTVLSEIIAIDGHYKHQEAEAMLDAF